MRDWLDNRTGFRALSKHLLDEPLPSGVGWWFVTGSIVLFLLSVQLLTGVLLAVFYSPSPDHAYDSVRFIMERVTFGRVLRGLHFFGASFIVIAAVVHMLRVVAFGSYKKPRELNWVVGVLLLLIILAFALTGYLLPWDQKAYWATTVTLNIARSVPLAGNFVSGLLKGGTDLGALTLMRWYAAHVFLLPACLIVFTVAHIYLMRRHGISGPVKAVPGPMHPFYPYQAIRDTIAIAVVFGLLLTMAVAFNAPLDALADPTDATYVPRPEWYFMSLFELLKHFPGPLEPVATVIIPGLVLTLLFLLPFLDRRPDREPGKRLIVIASFVFVFAIIGALTYQGFHSTPPASAQSDQAIARGEARAAGQRRGPVMVEDVFKNVQALKGITVDEFMGTMGLMSASLGLCCNDCHPGAGTDKVVWESDENPRKVLARQMAFMVQAINRDNFSGRQAVTCWTCHRLRLTPLETPRLDQFYGEAINELDDVISKAEGVPSATQLLDKYLAAIGGADKAAGMTSIAATGKVVAFGSFGGGGNFEYFAQAPDKRAMLSHLPDGESNRTFDGRTGWFAIPLAVVPKYPLTGGELDGARIDAQLSFPTQIARALTGLRVGPVTDIDGKDVYLLQGNGARGAFVSLYFDIKSGLLVRTIRYTPSKIGKVPTQVDYEDYRDVGGVKFPYKWTVTWLDGRDVFDFADVKFNVPIDPAKFGEPVLTLPPATRAAR
ncbi:MAG TPA: photosynthetic reaction center cytochrome c subunit family protein [Vicinamibacterales bacterium]|nr:photosynthetic reaction center cytochrome c subunit family protein [Vicinamibacterales bacterium]